jgi:hypothetical protein
MKRYSIILACERFDDAYDYAQNRGWEMFVWTWKPAGWNEIREYRLVEEGVV